VNVTKFGAFVNVCPARTAPPHLEARPGQAHRPVEDVLNLGDEVTVRVDDIDNAGKLSLVLVGDDDDAAAPSNGDDAPAAARRGPAATTATTAATGVTGPGRPGPG